MRVEEVLRDLINIPTQGAIKSDHPIIGYLKNAFAGCDIVEVKDEQGNSHLLIGVNTQLKDVDNCVLLSGHIDTVSASEGHEAKTGQADGKIFGLGSADMKCFFASIISQLDRLKASKTPIVLSITTDEETTVLGIKAVLQEMKERNITPGFVVVGEPTSSQISLSNMGNTVFLCKFRGKSCHSSTPELGVNAIYLAARFIAEVERIGEKYKGQAAICVPTIGGGQAPNVVPDACDVKVSVRTASREVLVAITQELQEAQKQACVGAPEPLFLKVFEIPPFEQKKNAIVDYVQKKTESEVARSAFTTETGFIQEAYADADCVIYGVGAPEVIHKAGENVVEHDLEVYSGHLAEVVDDYSKQSSMEAGKCKNS